MIRSSICCAVTLTVCGIVNITAAETVTPLQVAYPQLPLEQFISAGQWQPRNGTPVSSGQGWEYLYPKRYSALKIITVETAFEIPKAASGGGAGIRLGTHVGRPQEGWTYMYYPADKKLKFEFRSVNGVKLLREIGADLSSPYTLKLEVKPAEWVFFANGKPVWKEKTTSAPVFYHSGASSLNAVMLIRRLAVSGGEKVRPVIAFGDSITHHCQWQRYVAEKTGVPITNGGMACDDTIKALTRFDTDILALHPKIVILYLGTNNSDPDRAAADLATIVDRLQKNNIAVILCTAIPREALLRIDRLNVAVRRLAAEKHLPLVDWNPLLDDGHKKIKAEYGGPVHPNQAGAKLMAEFFVSQPEARKILDRVR